MTHQGSFVHSGNEMPEISLSCIAPYWFYWFGDLILIQMSPFLLRRAALNTLLFGRDPGTVTRPSSEERLKAETSVATWQFPFVKLFTVLKLASHQSHSVARHHPLKETKSFKPDVALLFVTRKARWGRGVKSLDIVLWLWLFDKLKRCWLQLPASSSTSSPCGRPSTTWPPPSPSWPSCSCSWSGLECSRSGLSRPRLRSSLGFNIQLLWRILQWLSSLLLDSFGRNIDRFLQHIELWLMYVDLFYLVAIWFAWQNNCQISFCLITVLFCFNF